MKTIGVLGGMSAESTAVYYRELNRLVRERLGGLHSAELLIRSLDFAVIAALQAADRWDETGAILAEAARRLEAAGADIIVLATNTMHLNADAIRAAVSVPFLHIGDATAGALKARGVTRPLLLGTRFTMEKAFYKNRLIAAGLAPLVPGPADRDRLQAIIYDELCQGVVRAESKAAALAMIVRGRADGADGVIFGCTEVGLLLSPDDVDLPVVDTTFVHCEAAVDFALA
ncbi:MAG: aspartate/glutamate racemase family protein [Alphaproteobacteria bacterium]|nr:aspartate/glutamate racemase family protein [Alphaproteobacteria bacterium]MBU1513950.1 aspartate/glutamate racemase family protein [Alphaproteobacteria bacterium]MBU2092618.1 aspartate/glutamate racemase family protein [Alphaproteobacteria bacterium]MBU2154261.1 aspartate/glutamate racemase family protein [Alphaproteobacteria bacterium]MBU2309493.1 aspartate/glutamate racemase family protein [Alphaproteobacteria bacterium]